MTDPFFMKYILDPPRYFAIFERYFSFYNNKLSNLPVFIESVDNGFILVINTIEFLKKTYCIRTPEDLQELVKLSQNQEVTFLLSHIKDENFPPDGLKIQLQFTETFPEEFKDRIEKHYSSFQEICNMRISLGDDILRMSFLDLAATGIIIADLFTLFLTN